MADIEYRYGLKMVHTIVREIGRAFLFFLMLICYYTILARPSMIGISRFDQKENFMYSYILKMNRLDASIANIFALFYH